MMHCRSSKGFRGRFVAGTALLSALSLTATVTPAQQPAAKAKASIEGVVTRAGTGAPIAGARVTLLPVAARTAPATSFGEEGEVRFGSFVHRATSNDAVYALPASSAPAYSPGSATGGGYAGLPPSPIPSVATDTLGKFAFESLEAGDYQLWIAANGYVAQEYSQSSNPQDDKQLTLANGQTLGNLTIQLTPTGSIAGRVLSASGGPAVGVRVSLYEKSYGLFGEPMLGDASGAARTNDRGEYRIFWITPGRYYVGAGESDTAYIPPHFNEVTNPFALMFYPNEKVFEAASPIEVRPGAVLEAMDFILQPQTFHRIRGRIIDTRTGRPPENAILSVSGWLPSGDRSYNKAYYNAANGTFEAPNVQPGEYVLTAHPRDLTAPTAQTPFSGTAAVSVVDADVDNVMLSITPPDSIAGQIRADAPLPVRLQVQLKSTGVFASSTDTISAVADDDGSFTLQAQRNAPMEYRVVIEELPPGWYLKEARLGDRDARTPTRLSGNGKLEILLSSRAGNVIGVIESAQGRPAPTDVTAVLVPDARQRLDLFQVVGFEPDGRFAFSNVAPGAYKIFAWEDIESSAWFDPALLKEFEDKATPVRVSESSRETVNVRAIPAGDGR